MADLTESEALMALSGVPKLGSITIHRLLAAFGNDPRRVLNASLQALGRVERVGPERAAAIQQWAQWTDLPAVQATLREVGARCLTAEDPAYPALLGEMPDPPVVLYQRGQDIPNLPLVAIVGTRHPSLYGRRWARRLAHDLALAGVGIVSGLAAGIDAEAHAGALEAGGYTIAVLGHGIDSIYPPENEKLATELITQGGTLLSEFPVGRRADRSTFPMRNRVVSALARAVVVVESETRGGSMITASFAADQGRLVAAIPGPVDQALSRGPHALIRDGATLITSAQDLLEDLNLVGQTTLFKDAEGAPQAEPTPIPDDLSENERKVIALFDSNRTQVPDAIASELGLPAQEAGIALMMLELKRLVVKKTDGSYERT